VACTSIFLEHLKISTIDFYIYRRAINWLGHVARMPSDHGCFVGGEFGIWGQIELRIYLIIKTL